MNHMVTFLTVVKFKLMLALINCFLCGHMESRKISLCCVTLKSGLNNFELSACFLTVNQVSL